MIHSIGGIDNKSNAKSFHGGPQYTIITQTGDTHIDVERNFKMEIFISGAGDVDISRISVSIPRSIVEGEKVRLKRMVYNVTNANNGEFSKELKVENVDPRFYSLIDNILYKLIKESDNNFSTKPQILGESEFEFKNNGTLYAPYTVDFKIDNNAPAGDYNIFIHYFYKYSDNWFQDSKIVAVHINHWYEEEFWIKVLMTLTITGALVTIFGAVAIIVSIWKDRVEVVEILRLIKRKILNV